MLGIGRQGFIGDTGANQAALLIIKVTGAGDILRRAGAAAGGFTLALIATVIGIGGDLIIGLGGRQLQGTTGVGGIARGINTLLGQ